MTSTTTPSNTPGYDSLTKEKQQLIDGWITHKRVIPKIGGYANEFELGYVPIDEISPKSLKTERELIAKDTELLKSLIEKKERNAASYRYEEKHHSFKGKYQQALAYAKTAPKVPKKPEDYKKDIIKEKGGYTR